MSDSNKSSAQREKEKEIGNQVGILGSQLATPQGMVEVEIPEEKRNDQETELLGERCSGHTLYIILKEKRTTADCNEVLRWTGVQGMGKCITRVV